MFNIMTEDTHHRTQLASTVEEMAIARVLADTAWRFNAGAAEVMVTKRECVGIVNGTRTQAMHALPTILLLIQRTCLHV